VQPATSRRFPYRPTRHSTTAVPSPGPGANPCPAGIHETEHRLPYLHPDNPAEWFRRSERRHPTVSTSPLRYDHQPTEREYLQPLRPSAPEAAECASTEAAVFECSSPPAIHLLQWLLTQLSNLSTNDAQSRGRQ